MLKRLNEVDEDTPDAAAREAALRRRNATWSAVGSTPALRGGLRSPTRWQAPRNDRGGSSGRSTWSLPIERRSRRRPKGSATGDRSQVVLKVGPLAGDLGAGVPRRREAARRRAPTARSLIWDLADARPALVLNDIPGPVHALVFSRDGKRLAVGAGLPARTGSVRVYSVPDGTLIHDFAGHDDVVFGLAFRPDGGQLASASFDQSVRLWNLATDRPEGVFTGHSDFVYDVAYAPDGRSLLSVSKDRTIKLIDAKTLKEKRTYSNHNEDVMALAVQPGGAKFVSSGIEPQLRWWGLGRREAGDAGRRPRRAGASTRLQRQRQTADLGRGRLAASGSGTAAIGAFQRSLAGSVRMAICRGPLRRCQPRRRRRLGRDRPGLGRRLGQAPSDPAATPRRPARRPSTG